MNPLERASLHITHPGTSNDTYVHAFHHHSHSRAKPWYSCCHELSHKSQVLVASKIELRKECRKEHESKPEQTAATRKQPARSTNRAVAPSHPHYASVFAVGTGEMLISVACARLLLTHGSNTIVASTYTNHALDQFLEAILDSGYSSAKTLWCMRRC
jgi:hypothetical protein